ncbi:MAG: prevent-host-death family protein, partial [Marinicellaceae bacterium]
DPGDYELMQRRLAIMEGIARGESDIRAGRVYTHDEVKQKLSKWLK